MGGYCAALPGAALPPGGGWEEESMGAGEGNPPLGNPPSAAGSGPAAFKVVSASPILDKTWASRSSSSAEGRHLDLRLDDLLKGYRDFSGVLRGEVPHDVLVGEGWRYLGGGGGHDKGGIGEGMFRR